MIKYQKCDCVLYAHYDDPALIWATLEVNRAWYQELDP